MLPWELLDQGQDFVDHHVNLLYGLAGTRHTVHGAANGLAFPERRARANHGIQQRHIAVIAQDLDGLTGD
ncbi:hypothetical protein D3C71_2161300 [compost metagenome]